MRGIKLPASLRNRVRDYYEYRFSQQRYYNQKDILQSLSPALRQVCKVDYLSNSKYEFTKIYTVSIITNDFQISLDFDKERLICAITLSFSLLKGYESSVSI